MSEAITSAPVILSVRDLDVKFHLRGRTLNAIRGISLDLHQGESLAIVGESGSGKSVRDRRRARSPHICPMQIIFAIGCGWNSKLLTMPTSLPIFGEKRRRQCCNGSASG